MGFKVKVVLSGLCAYVPNKPLRNPSTRPTKMLAVMPDATENRLPIDLRIRRARDGRKLRRHFPIVGFSPSFLVDCKGLKLGNQEKVLWSPLRKELSFKITEEVSGVNDFEVVQDFVNIPPRREDFNWGVRMSEVAPGFEEIDARCLRDVDSKDLVISRLRIEKGKVSSFNLNTDVEFTFSTILGSSLPRRHLSNEVAVLFEGLTEFILQEQSLDESSGPIKEIAKFVAPDNETVEIEIGNLCGDCLFPEDRAGNLPPNKDKDFRWHYELSAKRGDLPDKLGLRSLPIPEPRERSRGSGGKPVQCMRVSFKDVDF